MTSMQPHPSESGSSEPDLFEMTPTAIDASAAGPGDVSFGSRLRSAREARGLSVEACAQTLKLPVRVLRDLEHDAYAGIDSKIYLGSYIAKYGQFLGINDASIQVERDRIRHVEPPLVATGGISHSRFLLDRYATAATYVVLTAVIMVPMVWLGVRGTMDRSLTHLAPLDSAPVAQQDAPAGSSSGATAPLASSANLATVAAPLVPQDHPLMASMAAFPSMETAALPAAAPPVLAPATLAETDAGTGSHSLNLTLTGASWVEVVDHDGKKLEYGLLPAGSSRTYHSDVPLDVRIGNSSGTQISIDGQTVDMDEYRHANVAHFRMQMQDGKASAASL
jgi:cytoskeleton protein RodZ